MQESFLCREAGHLLHVSMRSASVIGLLELPLASAGLLATALGQCRLAWDSPWPLQACLGLPLASLGLLGTATGQCRLVACP